MHVLHAPCSMQSDVSDNQAEAMYGGTHLANEGVFWVLQPPPLPGQVRLGTE